MLWASRVTGVEPVLETESPASTWGGLDRRAPRGGASELESHGRQDRPLRILLPHFLAVSPQRSWNPTVPFVKSGNNPSLIGLGGGDDSKDMGGVNVSLRKMPRTNTVQHINLFYCLFICSCFN